MTRLASETREASLVMYEELCQGCPLLWAEKKEEGNL
jgi:hypothetical protein